ncbi:unnamed protein product [Allacma fusca]|uniref:HAT C-terminal dimerisation domain-containing protein n=1 Tax=Allacma fusca TaxID=39272 RepID=A0A8J2PYG1_9HEXA|nr:unnamed protein product [Allacma fusca]
MRKVVSQYDIPQIKVFRSMTDGASNMIASHRLDNKIFCEAKETRKKLVSDYDSDDDSSEDDIAGSQERHNIGVVDVDDVCFQNEFEMSPAYRRLTCFIHTTLNCLKSFDEDRNVKLLISKVQEMQSQINHSHVLVEELHKSSGVGLIAFCSTRWNYVYNVMSRLKRIKSSIEYVLLKYKRFTLMLSEEDWLKIEKMVTFLQPFSEYTNMSSREREAISSEVIVTIISIYMHMDAYDHDDFLSEPAKIIKENLKQKFSHMFYDKPEKPLEGTFIAATLLDPRYRLVMPASTRVLAREFLLREYTLLNPSSASNVRSTILPSPESSASKTRGKFPLIEQLKERTLMENSQSIDSSCRKFEEELDSYLACKTFDAMEVDADVFKFWLQKRHEYNLLAPLALDYLSIPATSAPVERVFSRGGLLTIGDCNRLDGENLEDKIIMSKNRDILEDLDTHFRSSSPHWILPSYDSGF